MAWKYIHIVSAILTFLFFFTRGIWMLMDSSMLRKAWVKVAPHCIDAVLLISAIVLAVRIQQFPGTHAWLSAKLIAVLAYIALGMIALRLGPTRVARMSAWWGALAVFLYIVAVAITRNPLPFGDIVS
jgi:uncharacterized membrane protein SirB2